MADKLILLAGGLGGAAILLTDPIDAGVNAGSPGEAVSAVVTSLRDMPASRYFEAIAPPLAAGIAVTVRRGAGGAAGRLIRSIGRAAG